MKSQLPGKETHVGFLRKIDRTLAKLFSIVILILYAG